MLQFLSFAITFILISGFLTFIVLTIRNASESVLNALNGQAPAPLSSEKFVNFDRRAVRPPVARYADFAPLRAAA